MTNPKELVDLLVAAKSVCSEMPGSSTFHLRLDTLRKAGKAYDKWAENAENPTHVHIKSGNKYKLLLEGTAETGMAPTVAYSDVTGKVWFKTKAEWETKFDRLPPAGLVSLSKTVVEKASGFKHTGLWSSRQVIADWMGPDYLVTGIEGVPGNSASADVKVFNPETGKNEMPISLHVSLNGVRQFVVYHTDWIVKFNDGTFAVISDIDFGKNGLSRVKS